MKKITLLLSIFISTLGFSQSYHGIYVENTLYGGSTSIASSYLYNSTETLITNSSGTEGANHRKIDILASDWYMAEYTWSTVNLSAFTNGHYNISIKTDLTDAFYIRFQSGANRIRITLNASTGTYGLAADGQWHTLSIPFGDFEVFGGTAAADAFTAVDKPIIIRSISNASGASIIEYDGVFLSTTNILSVDSLEKAGGSMYPNPASNEFNIKSLNTIDDITMYSMLGQKVLNMSPKSTFSKVDVSSLNSGLYVVEITSNGKTLATRFIKK